MLAVFAYNQWQGASAGPRIGWLSVLAGWLLVSSAPGRGAIVAMARRLLLARLRPGRYPRRSWLACRLWFVERLADVLNVDQLAGTPWAARYARLFGAEVGEGARLATLPSPSALARIGAGATIEAEVDLRGWWVEDSDLVVGEVSVGPGARVGTRCALMPGADVGAWAEVEPGSVITGEVPAGERWSGSPARRVGRAGDDWPATAPGPGTRRRARVTKIRFALGLGLLSLLPLAAAGPEVVILWGLNGHLGSLPASFGSVAAEAPLLVASYIATYALVAGLLVRALGRLVRPGWYRDDGVLAYALWLSGSIMARTRGLLFPLYAALITRPWLRLMGVRVGKRTEVSVAVGLSALTSLGDASFVTDDVVFSNVRARDGWLRVTPIEVGSRTFLGNGAILRPGTVLGDECLVGVLSSPPTSSANGTSWLGLPALELPRVPERPDPSRTVSPPRHLVVARAAMELVRVLVPGSVSLLLGLLIFDALERIGTAAGLGHAGGGARPACRRWYRSGCVHCCPQMGRDGPLPPRWPPAVVVFHLARRARQHLPGTAGRCLAPHVRPRHPAAARLPAGHGGQGRQGRVVRDPGGHRVRPRVGRRRLRRQPQRLHRDPSVP